MTLNLHCQNPEADLEGWSRAFLSARGWSVFPPQSGDASERHASEYLRLRGYHVERESEWESPSELCERLHISHTHLWRALKNPRCPKPHETARSSGEKGTGRLRIRYIRSTALLDNFLTRHLRSNQNPARKIND